MSWNYTDAAYYLDCTAFTVPFEESEALEKWQKARADYGSKVQYRTYGYGVVSLLCSMLGTAAVYSTLRSGVGVNAGFVLATSAAAMTCFDVVRLGMQRNTLFEECSRLANTDVGQESLQTQKSPPPFRMTGLDSGA